MSDNKLKVLGIIPARGGSRRLPRKNIIMLAGKPLVAHTIRAAQLAGSLTDFLVSSDDEEIAETARKFGAPVPFIRPAELATDEVRNIDVVDHALRFMEAEKKIQYDIIVLLQPTSPVRDPEHIDSAVRMLAGSDADTAVSVKGPYKKRDPILKAVRNGMLEDYCHIEKDVDVEPFYIYNASIYAVKRNYFVENKKLISPRQVPIVMDQFHSIDVDTEADLFMAGTCLLYLKNKGKDHD